MNISATYNISPYSSSFGQIVPYSGNSNENFEQDNKTLFNQTANQSKDLKYYVKPQNDESVYTKELTKVNFYGEDKGTMIDLYV